MNPREFCMKDRYKLFIATTYNFEPEFFESVILRDIQSSCDGPIIIAADQSYLQSQTNIWREKKYKFGKEYLLTPVGGRYLFHPKILLKIHNEEIKIWVGSNNLTYAGWYHNREIASVLSASRSDIHKSGILSVLTTLCDYIRNQQVIDFIKDYLHWFSENAESNVQAPIVLTPKKESLSAILKKRWDGRSFKRLRLYTGSTDEDGAFIKWCAETFGIEECIVATNPENVSFNIKTIKNLPVNLLYAPVRKTRNVHAKCYIFEGRGKPSVVFGSANCSKSAWLKSPEDGGNVECIGFVDELHNTDIAFIEDFPDKQIPMTEMLNQQGLHPVSQMQRMTSPVMITSVLMKRSSSALQVELNGHCELIKSVNLIYGKINIKLIQGNDDKRIWVNDKTLDCYEWQSGFCEIRIQLNVNNHVSYIWWIDDDDELRKSFSQRGILEVYHNLNYAIDSNDIREILEDTAKIQDIIFNISDMNYPKSSGTFSPGQRRNKAEDGVHTELVTPEMLIRSLSDPRIEYSLSEHIHYSHPFLSFAGILQVIFGHEVTDSGTNDSELITSYFPPDNRIDTNRNSIESDEYDLWIIWANKKIVRLLERFFDRFTDTEFGNRCDLIQFQRAVAYPLAVVVIGTRRGWLDKTDALEYVAQLVDILFHKEYEDDDGLLQHIINRFKSSDNMDFIDLIGDGTLWLLLLLAVTSTQTKDRESNITKARVLKTIYRQRLLIERANPRKLLYLKASSDFTKAVSWLNINGNSIVNSMSVIESELIQHKSKFIENQRREFEEGDLLFHSKFGWGWYYGENENNNIIAYFQSRAEPVIFANSTYFICLKDAIKNSKIIKDELVQLEMKINIK